ncbi:MAG: hypothetical protein F6K62_26375 [Sphaerospermopsis sp. SIO1G2]|nr:hypothetical protein [Sphaerospermopsis sp. SIO1G1]NET74314.1 hypothetical protein [Sphaerospermopsis sp. SIO1G2]
MRFDWNDQKSQLLKSQRGYYFDEIINLFAGDYVERVKNDDPQQFIAIGYAGYSLLSVIYKVRYDEEGEYIWLVTYWKSTKREREIYEQYFYG